MNTTFIYKGYIHYPFCAQNDALDSLSRIADVETGGQMTFPDTMSIGEKIRAQLESRGMKFEDAITVEYEPIYRSNQ